MAGSDFEAAKLHSPRQALQECSVIVDDDQRAIFGQFVLLK
jgi:hypothetical protein